MDGAIMYNNLQLIEGFGIPEPSSAMNRRQARAFLQGVRKKCDRLRRMAREAAKAGDKRRAATYFRKFQECKKYHKQMAAKLGLARPPGQRRPLRVGMRTMVAGRMPSPSAKGSAPVMRMDGYGYGFYGDDGDEDDDILGEDELETLKNIGLKAKGIFAPKVGETKTGGDIKVGLFPGGDLFPPGAENVPKVAGGIKIEWMEAGDTPEGPVFRPVVVAKPDMSARMAAAASQPKAKAGWGAPQQFSMFNAGRRFDPISPYIPRMPGPRFDASTRQDDPTGPRIPIGPMPLPPTPDPGPPRPINIPDIPVPDSPNAGWGKPAPIGFRTMVPAAPISAGPTVYDPRQEMIPQAQARMGPTPFGPGATIYRPDIPKSLDPPDKFMGLGDLELALDGYGLFHPEVGGKRPTTMKLLSFLAIGGVVGHMAMGKSKKQKQHSALIGAGIGAAVAYFL